jgi:hypothetical protein
MCTCNKQHWLHWMWLQDVSFNMYGRSYLLKCYCWRVKMIKHGMIACIIMSHILFSMWMAKFSHIFLMVVTIGLWCMLCVDNLLGPEDYMLICDQYSQGRHTGCQMLPLGEILIKKWFLSMHQIYVGTYFYGQIWDK